MRHALGLKKISNHLRIHQTFKCSIGNDACDCLERNFGSEMMKYYSENPLKKSGQGPGGKYNGPSIKYILQEEVLVSLEKLFQFLPAPLSTIN